MNKLVAVVAILALVALAEAAQPKDVRAFRNWMKKHNKQYVNQAEFESRLDIFVKNSEFIRTHNANPKKTHTVALNKFADLTNEEFREMYNGFNKLGRTAEKSRDTVVVSAEPQGIPATWDWRKQKAVTHVKNQQQCGSCWSFSTTGSTEGCHAIASNFTSLVALSEQNLMDCSTSYGNQGCDGGLMTLAFEYIINNKGIDTEKSYPYTAEDGTCQFNRANVGATLSSYVNVTSGDENNLLSEAYNGPVSVAIDASQDSFQFYDGGVYSDPNCGNCATCLDHGVLVVGWGTYQNQAYWLVKNSWGTDWGLSGYIMMARNDNNMCGIATMASRPEC